VTSPQTSQEQLERLVRWNARWTTVLLLLFVGLLGTTVCVAVLEARRRLDPDRLVDDGESYIKVQYPQWREELRQEIVKAAPLIARRLTKRMEQSLPRSRAKLVAFLDRASIGADLSRTREVSEYDFREFIRANRADVQGLIAKVARSPGAAPDVAGELEKRLEKQFGERFREQANGALAEFTRLNSKLNQLSQLTDDSDKDLLKVERRIVRTLRALQEQREKSAKKTVGE
jgi:hypothetical protein